MAAIVCFRQRQIVAIVAACCLAAKLSAGVMTPIANDPVSIAQGRVSGTMLPSGVRAYYGIPFAAPPVRDNRWRAPQPVATWSGIYNADTKRAECYQGLRSNDINHYFGDEDAAEDCLYLNVWAPADAKPGARLPVLVWIYGGAFAGGSASMAVYSGEPLAKKGVIYVAINYRLGVFGFLAHPELSRETGHGSGNWGFLDQVAGLQWVQRNIAAFGGDPANVTLVGQSAGSMSINNLQASPLAKGLFVRAFGMSGATVAGGAGAGTPLAEAEAQGTKLQAAMKASSVADMRTFSPDKVQAIAQASGVRAGPDIDGYYLPQTVDAIFAAGRQNDVAVVTGSTANDIGTNPPIRAARNLVAYREAAVRSYAAASTDFLKLWPATDDASATREAEQVGRNSGFALGARNWARLQTATGKQPAYLFMLSRVQPFTPGVAFRDFDPRTAGAYHLGDVPYVLGTYEAFNLFRSTRDWTPYDRQLSNDLQDLVVAYATTGTPTTAEIKLVRYDPKREQRVDFGDAVTTEMLNTAGMDFLFSHPAPPPARGGPSGPPAGPVDLPASPRF